MASKFKYSLLTSYDLTTRYGWTLVPKVDSETSFSFLETFTKDDYTLNVDMQRYPLLMFIYDDNGELIYQAYVETKKDYEKAISKAGI